MHIRNGTGQDFPDPTSKFQNLRRLTGRSTDFFTEGSCSLFNASNEKFFQKGSGHGRGVKICDSERES